MDSIPRTVSDRTAKSGAAATGGRTTQPTVPSLAPDGIPPELRAGKRFVAWRSEDRSEPKPAKVPYSDLAPSGANGKRASSTDPAHWMTFDRAARYAQLAGLDGVMRAFASEDGIVGLDFDNCRDPETGELSARATEYVRRLDTYTEVSPSGRGIKLWAYGSLPPHGRKRGDVELYDRARFFTLTGRHLAGTPAAVKYRPDAIATIHREVFGDAPDPITAATAERDGPIPALELGDEEVIHLASESPHNGARFRRLWAGDTGDYAADGNDGQSEADGALCELLAYYGGPDPERIDRLFRRSGLYRDKWDRPDYRERTIRLALTGKTRFYGEGITPPPSACSDGAIGCACESCPAVAQVGRLRRLALDRDDLVEYQQGIIRSQRTRLDEKTAFLSHVSEVLAKPNEELSAGEKVVSIALAYEIHFRADRETYRLPNGAIRMDRTTIARRSGYSPNKASALGRQVAARDNAPFAWAVKRDRGTRADGSEGWVSKIEIRPRTERTADTLRAIATLPALLDRPKHGGSKAAAEARWGRCDRHDNAEVHVKGYCLDCGKVVGERTVSVAEFEGLKVQDGVSEGAGDGVAVSVPTVIQDGVSDGLIDELAARRAREAVAVQTRAPDRWKQPGLPDLVTTNGHAEGEGLQQPAHRNGLEGGGAPPVWKHAACGGTLGSYRDSEGRARCVACSEVVE